WMPMGKNGEIVLPATVTSIGAYAFRGCHFTEFVMSHNVKEMGQAAFYGSKVEKVILSDALKTIATAAFQQCANLREVHLGTATEQLGEYVFDGTCLEHLYVTAAFPPVCYDNTFATNANSLFDRCTLHVPAESASQYRNHRYWGKFNNIEVF
ncbi:MAG: leucine-rich repeat domain-containing protein, partial [Prevotella sp.]